MKNPTLTIECDLDKADDIFIAYDGTITYIQTPVDGVELANPDKVRMLAAKLNEMAAEMEKNK